MIWKEECRIELRSPQPRSGVPYIGLMPPTTTPIHTHVCDCRGTTGTGWAVFGRSIWCAGVTLARLMPHKDLSISGKAWCLTWGGQVTSTEPAHVNDGGMNKGHTASPRLRDGCCRRQEGRESTDTEQQRRRVVDLHNGKWRLERGENSVW